jgi:hypothetical protein
MRDMDALNEALVRDFLRMTDTQGDIAAWRFRDGSNSEACVHIDPDYPSNSRFYPWTPIKK